MTDLIDRHRRACDGFSRVAAQVAHEQWALPTPCPEWDARALVEHVIGFHEFLLLRPLGVRANRPKSGPAARWTATSSALFGTLDAPGTLEQATDLPGGGQSSPLAMLGALSTDVLVHTWDLARATGVDPALDLELCAIAFDTMRGADVVLPADMYAAPVPVPADADMHTKLLARVGRDPGWSPASS